MLWLLEENTRLMLERVVASGWELSAEQKSEYLAVYKSDSSSNILTTTGNSAEISIRGVLTQNPNILAMFFGGGNTTYPSIIKAITKARADSNISEIKLSINSPGGEFDGLFDVIAALQECTIPVKAVVDSVCASAAYAIASQANTITARNVAAKVGSIGVVGHFKVDSETEVTIASSKAPKKAPDLKTDEGKDIARETLDAMHDIFVNEIAEGRGVTAEKINADYGQGAVLLAGEALKRGMIDSIQSASNVNDDKTALSGGEKLEENMDLETLRAKHPEVYTAAVQAGSLAERERAVMHLTAGEKSGDFKTAFAAIRDGSEMTPALQTAYLLACANRRDIENRQEDETAAAQALKGAEGDISEEEKKTASEMAIFKAAAEQCGIELEGFTNA